SRLDTDAERTPTRNKTSRNSSSTEPYVEDMKGAHVYELAYQTRDQTAEVAPVSVAVLPNGSLEQHGEHLPLGTDTKLVETVARRALRDLENVVLCPTVPYG